MSNDDSLEEKLLIDAPITSSEEDLLGRAPIAKNFAQSILELNSSQGLVVGVLGPWGCGKSSFTNLMKETLVKGSSAIVTFNPWLFSGTDQLVDFFFKEIGAELHVKDESLFGPIVKQLNAYAGVIKPIAKFIPVPYANAIAEILGASIKGASETSVEKRSAQEIRKNITEQLEALESPIVVVLDDIDRLTTSEIREIFKLVRLTANFPNVIYILEFDRERVEQVLTEDGIPGRAYLEKIIQLSFDVPQAPETLLQSRILDELDRILPPAPYPHFDESRLPDVYWELLKPLFTNLRDVKRYAVSAKFTIEELGDEIDLVDLLVMEAIRLFRPDLFQQLPKIRKELTSTSIGRGQGTKAVDDLLVKFSEDKELIHSLFRFVFPAAVQYIRENYYGSDESGIWRASHRIAHIDFLNFYFDRVEPGELATFRKSEEVFTLLNNAHELESYLRELDPNNLEDILGGLTSYETQFATDMVVPGSTVLLNLIDSAPEREPRGFFDSARKMPSIVRHLVRELLRTIEKEEDREKYIRHILEEVETYSSKLCLIQLVGHDEHLGYQLVSEKFADILLDNFIKELQTIPPLYPEREWDGWRIYDVLRDRTGKAPLTPDEKPALLREVFHSTKSTSARQTSGSRSITYTEHLAWNLLVPLFGTETAVKAAVNNVRNALGDDEVLQLVDQYLSGERTNEF